MTNKCIQEIAFPAHQSNSNHFVMRSYNFLVRHCPPVSSIRSCCPHEIHHSCYCLYRLFIIFLLCSFYHCNNNNNVQRRHQRTIYVFIYQTFLPTRPVLSVCCSCCSLLLFCLFVSFVVIVCLLMLLVL